MKIDFPLCSWKDDCNIAGPIQHCRHENRRHHRPRSAWTYVRRLRLEHLFALHPDAATEAIARDRLQQSAHGKPLRLRRWSAASHWRFAALDRTLRSVGAYAARPGHREYPALPHFPRTHRPADGHHRRCRRAVPALAAPRSFCRPGEALIIQMSMNRARYTRRRMLARTGWAALSGLAVPSILIRAAQAQQ